MTLRKLVSNHYLQIWLFAFATLCIILAGVESDKRIICIIPFLTISALLLVFNPSLVSLLFICSFFVGDPLIYHLMILVDSADFSLMLLSAAILSVLFTTSKPSLSLTPTDNRIVYTLLIMTIVSVLSILLNLQTKKLMDITTSIWYVFNFLQLIAVYLVFSRTFVVKRRETFITTVLVLSLIEIMLAFSQFRSFGQTDVEKLREVTGTFVVHHAMLGNMMVLPLAFCLYRLLTNASNLYRIFYFSGIVASLFTIIISGSRSILFGVFAAGFAWLLVTFKISRKYFLSILVVLTVAAGIFLFTPLRPLVLNTFKNSRTATLDMSAFGRLLIWKGALLNFAEAPLPRKLFGIGIGNYYTMKYSIQLIEGNGKTATGAHNNYLHVLTETGIVGFAAFITLFTFILVNLHRRSKTDRLSYTFFFATIALLFSGFTQETFWFQPAFSRFWLLYMVFLGVCLGSKPNDLGAYPKNPVGQNGSRVILNDSE